MDVQTPVSGIRETPPDSSEPSWSSSSDAPSYHPFPETHEPHGSPIDTKDFRNPHPNVHRYDSYKEVSVIPEIQSPGLESVWSGEGDKEVFTPGPAPIETNPQQHVYNPSEQYSPRRTCGMRRKWFWILLITGLVLIIGLGAGLGAGLGTKKKTRSSPALTSTYNIGGALDPEYYSRTGAFNGTGIAISAYTAYGDTHGSLVLYFQHSSGQIRWLQLSAAGEWLGGTLSEVVAVDAKNSTPISSVAILLDQVYQYHVFYIDTNNTLRQRSNSNATNVWVDGPLSSLNLAAFDADEVGMQTCWYGNKYNDSDYVNSPFPSDGATDNTSVSNYQNDGMHLWYPSDNHTFQQYGWREGDLEWTYQRTWTGKDGHATPGCYSWGPGTVSYLMFVNLDQTIEFWWKDTNSSMQNTTQHPINTWTNASISIPQIQPSTSLAYTHILYAQSSLSSAINGYNISWAAENTSLLSSPNSFTLGGPFGIPGTGMVTTTMPSNSGGDDLVVFCQTNGSDLTQFSRDIVSGGWSELGLPVPLT